MSDTEKEWMTLDEASDYIGVGRATVYNYMKDLHITTRRFGRDRRGYLALADVKRMKDYKENPWKVELDGEAA
jgi:excisionase family DNA binding protein